MPPRPAAVSSSLSHEMAHDDDDSSSRGDSMPPDGDGDGKGKSASQSRKAQNRIAQRDFRLRKQQYIRDLEARVEILSGDKEERAELMILLIRNLLKENKDLRNMVQTMASFVGEGLGSCLPRLGLSASQLDAILNRADTDTAYDAFLTLKASKEMEKANPGIPIGAVRPKSTVKRKREAEDGSASKEPHSESVTSTPEAVNSHSNSKQPLKAEQPVENPVPTAYDYLFPDLDAFANNRYPASQVNPYYLQPMQQSSSTAASYFNMPDPSQSINYLGFPPQQSFSGFGVTAPGPSQPMSSSFAGMNDLNTATGTARYGYSGQLSSPADPRQNAPAPMSNSNMPPPVIPPAVAATSTSTSTSTAHPPMSEEEQARERTLKDAIANLTEGDRRVADGHPLTPEEMQERLKVQERLMHSLPDSHESNRLLEAMQMITYHLNNYRVNHNYVLPPSLRPTKVQRTVAHEHAIDGVIFPSVRDRMILLRGRYDLVEAFHGIVNHWRLNGEDPLDHNNWEVSERWLTQFRMLVDAEVYEVTNRWRGRRGEAPLQMADMPAPL